MMKLKKRIENNNKQIRKKCVLVKPILEMMEFLIEQNASDEIVKKWLKRVDNVIYTINYKLDQIEKKKE